MAVRLTFTPPDLSDPIVDTLREHIANLLEPEAYRRLAPKQGKHPAEVYESKLRAYLEARNQKERSERAAFAVVGYPAQGFQPAGWDMEDVA